MQHTVNFGGTHPFLGIHRLLYHHVEELAMRIRYLMAYLTLIEKLLLRIEGGRFFEPASGGCYCVYYADLLSSCIPTVIRCLQKSSRCLQKNHGFLQRLWPNQIHVFNDMIFFDRLIAHLIPESCLSTTLVNRFRLWRCFRRIYLHNSLCNFY